MDETGGLMESQKTGPTGLRMLRLATLQFGLALVAIGVIVFFLRDAERTSDGALAWCSAVIGIGIVFRVVSAPFEPKLDPTSDEALVASYRSRLFVRIAVAEVPALVAFVGSFVGPWWTYYVGLAVALLGIARAAPTSRNIARDDEDLIMSGSSRRLASVLGSFYVRRG